MTPLSLSSSPCSSSRVRGGTPHPRASREAAAWPRRMKLWTLPSHVAPSPPPLPRSAMLEGAHSFKSLDAPLRESRTHVAWLVAGHVSGTPRGGLLSCRPLFPSWHTGRVHLLTSQQHGLPACYTPLPGRGRRRRPLPFAPSDDGEHSTHAERDGVKGHQVTAMRPPRSRSAD